MPGIASYRTADWSVLVCEVLRSASALPNGRKIAGLARTCSALRPSSLGRSCRMDVRTGAQSPIGFTLRMGTEGRHSESSGKSGSANKNFHRYLHSIFRAGMAADIDDARHLH